MADVKIIGAPCVDSCLDSLEGVLSKRIDEGYVIAGQCVTPQGNIIYTLVKSTEEAAPFDEEIDIDYWIKNESEVV